MLQINCSFEFARCILFAHSLHACLPASLLFQFSSALAFVLFHCKHFIPKLICVYNKCVGSHVACMYCMFALCTVCMHNIAKGVCIHILHRVESLRLPMLFIIIERVTIACMCSCLCVCVCECYLNQIKLTTRMRSVDLNVHKSLFGLDGDLVDSEAMLNDVSNIEDFCYLFYFNRNFTHEPVRFVYNQMQCTVCILQKAARPTKKRSYSHCGGKNGK